MTAGIFIAFEGGEGAGKSTQLTRLAAALSGSGREVVMTHEPGATAIGAALRGILLDRANVDLAPRAEALLYAADRAQHVATVVRPAIDRGAVVLTDRYVDSSLAYQGGGRDLSVEDIASISGWATDDLRPDRVIVLDIDPQIGLARAGRVGEHDRLESETLDFHRRVRERFLEIASAGGDRYLVVDATADQDAIRDQIVEWLKPVIG